MNYFVTTLFTSVLFLYFFSFSRANAQVSLGDEIKTLFQDTGSVQLQYGKPLKESTAEFDVLISLSFLMYKTVISSQDEPRCVFTPSCSEYAVEAFKKKGPFIGWLETFDRLSRCHGFVNYSHYHFDQEKKRFYDPLQ